jgi:hypothetical protein
MINIPCSPIYHLFSDKVAMGDPCKCGKTHFGLYPSPLIIRVPMSKQEESYVNSVMNLEAYRRRKSFTYIPGDKK